MTLPLAEIKRMMEKATPGPWCSCMDGHMECREIADCGRTEIHSPSSPFVRSQSNDDADLIVAMRNAMPAIIERMEKLERVANDAAAYFDSDGQSPDAYNALSDSLSELDQEAGT